MPILVSNTQRQTGGVMLETALVLPLFLIGVLTFIWLTYSINLRSSLTSSISRALRLAVTRGNEEIVGSRLIEDIDDWLDGQNPTPRLEAMLASHDIGWQNAEVHYNNNTTWPVFHRSLRQMPPVYTYVLVYLNEGMRQSVGSSLRFPCDPHAGQAGTGCMSCTFLNPDNMKKDQPYQGLSGSNEPPLQSLGLECEVQPHNFILSPIFSLLRYVLGAATAPDFTIQQRSFIRAEALT